MSPGLHPLNHAGRGPFVNLHSHSGELYIAVEGAIDAAGLSIKTLRTLGQWSVVVCAFGGRDGPTLAGLLSNLRDGLPELR
jgi:hypothetical protein